ncbi:aspartyl/glutamyl-tRNA amidotransferase subunit A, partial [mine drainage metagenome]
RTKGFGAEVKRRIMLGTYALSSGYYDAYYAKAQQVRTLIKSGFERAYEQVDVLVSPVSPTTAFKLGEKSLDPLTMYLSDVCTIPSNLAGHPAMSMPYALDSQGLPIGVQILAPALREDLMFRLAFALEGSSRGAPSLDASIKEAINHG